MRSCEYMYMIEGRQLCKYSGFMCFFQGDRIMVEFMGKKDVVTLCDLNNTKYLGLEDKLEDKKE